MQIVLISATLILTVSVSAVQSETRCKKPESPERGSVMLIGEPTVGSLALYICDEGLTVFGTSAIKCLSTGEWTFGPPKCFRSCRVNDIKNGKIGRYESVRYSSGNRLEFSKLPIGQIVEHNETATLKCDSGFIPANLSEYSESDTEQITCIDGLWKATMVCREKPCLGHPPAAENASPVISNRTHGAVIWYRCDDGFVKVKAGKVFCDHGTWKGNTSTCADADTRCYTNQLNFEGLLKPKVTFVRTRSFFIIKCDRGYKKAVTKEKITCTYGQWDTKENPCKKETCDDDPPSVANGRPLQFTREHGSLVQYECNEHFHLVGTSEVRCEAGKWEGQIPFCRESVRDVTTSMENSTRNGIAPGLLHVSPSPNPLDPCFCTYDFDTNTTDAKVKGRRLAPGERIEKGEIVTFSCLYRGLILQWENGMIIFGTANLICRCKNLTQKELPTCLALPAGTSAFLYNDKMKILPGGKVEVTNKEPFEITCMNPWSQPNWHPQSEGLSVIRDSEHKVRQTGYYTATMHIPVVDNKSEGRYECLSTYNSRPYTPSVLELQIAGDCEVPMLYHGDVKEEKLGDYYLSWFRYVREVTYVKIYSGTIVSPGTTYLLFCHNGYSFQGTSIGRRRITCMEGRWFPDPVCLRDGTKYVPTRTTQKTPLSTAQQRIPSRTSHSEALTVEITTTSTTIPSIMTESPIKEILEAKHEEPIESGPAEEDYDDGCSCVYSVNDENLVASVGGKRLGFGDKVPDGSKVVFRCHYVGFHRFDGPRENKCENCGRWNTTVFPTCTDPKKGNAVIIFDNNLNVSVEGNLEARRGQNVKLICIAIESAVYPHWYIPDDDKISTRQERKEQKTYGDILYVSHLQIEHADFENEGQYECAVGDNNVTAVYLTVIDPNRLCPEFQEEEGISVSYEMGRRVNSKALFSCTNQGQELIGKASLTCQGNGQWSDTPPHCEDVKCKKLKEKDLLEIHYTNDWEIGSLAIFRCFFPAKRSGVPFTRCLENGTWADPAPTCISVPGCQLSKNVESLPLFEPVKEYYHFGESILLSCPPGQKLTPDVERVMCMGRTWSDELPDCT